MIIPVIIQKKGDNFKVSLNKREDIFAESDNLENALYRIKEQILLKLDYSELANEELENVNFTNTKNEFIAWIEIPKFNLKEECKSVKKTLTLAIDIDQEAKKLNLNYSALLERGIRRKLGLMEKTEFEDAANRRLDVIKTKRGDVFLNKN